jgi:hypothetical protein
LHRNAPWQRAERFYLRDASGEMQLRGRLLARLWWSDRITRPRLRELLAASESCHAGHVYFTQNSRDPDPGFWLLKLPWLSKGFIIVPGTVSKGMPTTVVS